MGFLFYCGCESDSTDPPSEDNITRAKERVVQANQIAIPRIARILNSQGRDTLAFNLSAANKLYIEAIDLDPNNTLAHFGAGVTGILTVFSDPALKRLQGLTTLLPIPKTMESLFYDQTGVGSIWKGGFGILQDSLVSIVRPNYPISMREKFRMPGNATPPSNYQYLLETKLLPALSDAIGHLQRVAQQQVFSFYVTADQLGENISDSIRIDLTEVYLLISALQAMSANVAFDAAYDVDYDSHSQIGVVEAWQTNTPYLSLRANGIQRMKDARTNYVGMATNIQNGITYLMNETRHPGTDPVKYVPADHQKLADMILEMDTAKILLAGAYRMFADFAGDNTPEYVYVNFRSFFENPVTNFKKKMPGYSVSTQTSGNNVFDILIVWQANSFNTWTFPDPTFNGIFPGMTDANFKQAFGLTSANWNNVFRIKG